MSAGASVPSMEISHSLIKQSEEEKLGRCDINDSPSGSPVNEPSETTPDQQPRSQPQSMPQPQLKEQPVDQQQRLSPKKPSHAKKLVDKFATFSPMRNKGSERRLIVETYSNYTNGKKEGLQSDQRPKSAEPKSLKKKKRPINITEGMSKADIFAANVASAVDAADAADDEEEYYTYSTSNSRAPSINSVNGLIPPIVPNLPQDNKIPQHFPIPSSFYSTFSYPYRTYNTFPHRSHFNPGFYNNPTTTSDSSNDQNSQNPNNNNNKPTGVMRSSLPDMSQYVKGLPNYDPTNYLYNNWYVNNERLPLFAKWRPPNYETRQRQSCTPTMSTLTVIIIFLMASSWLLYFASTCPLSDVSIKDISNVLAADKELMFDIQVKGRNYGLWDVVILDTDLAVFATPVRNSPGSIPGGPGSHWDDIEAVSISLGNIYSFDEPLLFPSGINRTGVASAPTGQVRLKNPGGKNDKEGQEKWSFLLQHQFDLTVRGSLKYTLPFSKDHSTIVCFVQRVDGGVDSLNSNGRSRVLKSFDVNAISGPCGEWEKEQKK